MSAGNAIAAEIAAGLADVGRDTGSGKLTATLIRPGAAIPDTYPPVRGADTTFDFTAMVTQFDRNELASGNVEAGDVKYLLEQGSTTPTTGDKIAVGGVRYAIEGVTSVAPGGVTLMWKILARGGVVDGS